MDILVAHCITNPFSTHTGGTAISQPVDVKNRADNETHPDGSDCCNESTEWNPIGFQTSQLPSGVQIVVYQQDRFSAH
jgi:hypothetical protein